MQEIQEQTQDPAPIALIAREHPLPADLEPEQKPLGERGEAIAAFDKPEAYNYFGQAPDWLTKIGSRAVERVASARGNFIAPVRELARLALEGEQNPDVSDEARAKAVALAYVETRKRIDAEYARIREPLEAEIGAARRRNIDPEQPGEKEKTDSAYLAALRRKGEENTATFLTLLHTYNRTLHNVWRRGDPELFGVMPEIGAMIDERLSVFSDTALPPEKALIVNGGEQSAIYADQWKRAAQMAALQILDLYRGAK